MIVRRRNLTARAVLKVIGEAEHDGSDGRTLFIAAAEWRGMSDAAPVPPGSGRVLAIDVEVPGAGWP